MTASMRAVSCAFASLSCLTAGASAQVSTPGSLLLFPEYDSRPGTGIVNLITVTNTDVDGAQGVETTWNFVRGSDCYRVDFRLYLDPRDTVTVITRFLNPIPGHGYLYVVATEDLVGPARVHNHLIGTSTFLNGVQAFDYTVQPIAFEGIGDGLHTDLDGDGVQDLDGLEYSMVADQIVIPRFFGQQSPIESELIMIDLTGGPGWQTSLDFVIQNDNSEQFSAVHVFECWAMESLMSISGIFDNSYLANNTNDAPNEILGSANLEAGWLRIDGSSSTNGTVTIPDPAFTCLLVERNPAAVVFSYSSVTVPPTALGRQGNGALPPTGETRSSGGRP